MVIFVKSASGNMITVATRPDWTISNVKRRVEELGGMPSEEQRLLLGKQDLPDDALLSTYNIVENTTLYLLRRVMNCCCGCSRMQETTPRNVQIGIKLVHDKLEDTPVTGPTDTVLNV
ncbi:hypothetical protein BGZ99_008803 [Dissophora globulifera]|uniref:Ubiquitin-like domain-containing protein n=1 Tax=Dissophora globulifera TaxID=979702 RepID=A0A9P6RRV9_9FUNG|nr:hypothetical protein BGZ99_008803 [Dissophora globulifera]